MARSFSLVDQKVAEAEFFLRHLIDSANKPETFALRCYCSAFISSARSITFSLQAVMSNIPGFAAWWSERQHELRSNPHSRFFHDMRTANQHIGSNLVSAWERRRGRSLYFFMPTPEVPEVPCEDVVNACREHFRRLLGLIFRCYLEFGPHINARVRFTEATFRGLGKTIEDAEEECGLPRGWTDIGDPDATPHRFELLRRQQAGCEIENLFETYLGQALSGPEPLAPYCPKPAP